MPYLGLLTRRNVTGRNVCSVRYPGQVWRWSTQTGGEMPIHHAVLGLLAEGPSYGYELKGSFEEAIGPQWGELNIGHLYQVLDRLMRDGFVTKRVVAQTDRPDRMVYR